MMLLNQQQRLLFPDPAQAPRELLKHRSTFTGNMCLPVHRWIRFSAGFSALWAEDVIRSHASPGLVVLDPFAGSATTLIAAERAGFQSYGIEAHPFVARMAQAKLEWRSNPQLYLNKIRKVQQSATKARPNLTRYSDLIRRCYDEAALEKLDKLRTGLEQEADNSPAYHLSWLTLTGILRSTSRVGTARWQYVLPTKVKRDPRNPDTAFEEFANVIYEDMHSADATAGPRSAVLQGDARECATVPPNAVDLVVTSPPYPNNYDYADATRLEMTFFGEITGWGQLQDTVRRHLVVSCSQHVSGRTVNLEDVLSHRALDPIRRQLSEVCKKLAEIRETKGGRKTYHLMVASYFRDLALTWHALRSVCKSPARACFVVGDSAPYGIYVPVIPWLGELAKSAGFKSYAFSKTRDRNVKWKNRKHRVPLQEGELWVEG
ncbi:MAG: DNA methyltransferase [Betaproteobacteria bacterium]